MLTKEQSEKFSSVSLSRGITGLLETSHQGEIPKFSYDNDAQRLCLAGSQPLHVHVFLMGLHVRPLPGKNNQPIGHSKTAPAAKDSSMSLD